MKDCLNLKFISNFRNKTKSDSNETGKLEIANNFFYLLTNIGSYLAKYIEYESIHNHEYYLNKIVNFTFTLKRFEENNI